MKILKVNGKDYSKEQNDESNDKKVKIRRVNGRDYSKEPNDSPRDKNVRILKVNGRNYSSNQPRIMSKRDFFANPDLHQQYKSLLKMRIIPEKEAKRHGVIKIISVISTRYDLEQDKKKIEQLYEHTANTVVKEIRNRFPDSDRVAQLKALFDFLSARCKYWDDYPRGENGIMARSTDCKIECLGKQYSAEDYNTKEVALLGGFSVCRGFAMAYQDLARRLGVDCEIMINSTHAWNMVYTDQGPRYIDCSFVAEHFKGNNPMIDRAKSLKRNFNKDEYFMVDEARLLELDRLPGRPGFRHSNGEISNVPFNDKTKDDGQR